MPTRKGKNLVGKYVEMPVELESELSQFAKSRGETFRSVIEAALRRHLDNPPPPPTPPAYPPLPPVPSPAPARPITRAREAE